MPSGWRLLSPKEIRASQKSRQSGNQEINYLQYQYGVIPFVSLVREGTMASPAQAVFFISRDPLDDERLASNERALALELGVFAYLYRGVRPVCPTVEVTIAGARYAHSTLRYRTHNAKGQQFEMERQFWVRAQGISAVVIEAVYEMKDAEVFRSDLDHILTSLRPGTLGT